MRNMLKCKKKNKMFFFCEVKLLIQKYKLKSSSQHEHGCTDVYSYHVYVWVCLYCVSLSSDAMSSHTPTAGLIHAYTFVEAQTDQTFFFSAAELYADWINRENTSLPWTLCFPGSQWRGGQDWKWGAVWWLEEVPRRWNLLLTDRFLYIQQQWASPFQLLCAETKRIELCVICLAIFTCMFTFSHIIHHKSF